jgi:hypothetical protein
MPILGDGWEGRRAEVDGRCLLEKPARINTEDWYRQTRRWSREKRFDAEASIDPGRTAAGCAHPWEITIKVGNERLAPGDHIAVELPVTWTPDRGRPYVYGRRLLSREWNPGYAATPKLVFPPGVKGDFDITADEQMNRYIILDIVLLEGEIGPGGEFRTFLANPEGTLIRCQWYAQNTPVPVAARKKNEDRYRRFRKIPQVMVTGGAPAMWKIVARLPGGPAAGASIPFEARIIAADAVNLNPAETPAEPRLLEADGVQAAGPERKQGYHGAPLWVVEGGRISAEKAAAGKALRVEVLNREQGLYGRSNPLVPGLHGDRRVWFGDLHGQSDRSIGYGTEREYFWWARDGELLDFTAPANHYGGREEVSEELWQSTLELCDEFYEPGKFATLYGYEWGSHVHGHRNVYYAGEPGHLFSRYGPRGVEGIHELWRLLEEQGLPVLTIPHHTRFIAGIRWEDFHARFQRLAEVCSCWGNSEVGGPCSVQAGLGTGHRLGVVGGTDTHFSQPGRPCLGPFDLGGLTAVLCEKLERESLWQALYDRRCYATTGDRILLDFSVNGQPMGSELEAEGPRAVAGRVIGTGELESVEVIRNNEVWKRVPCLGGEEVCFSFIDGQEPGEIALTPRVPSGDRFLFYYLRVQQRNRHWAMSSPVWVEEMQ